MELKRPLSRARVKILFGISTSIVFFGIAYTNCTSLSGGGISLVKSASMLVSSKSMADLPSLNLSSGDQCNNFTTYRCHRRIFSPDVPNQELEATECTEIKGKEVCVLVKSISLNTRHAKSTADSADFLPGGEFNRTEMNCYHSYSQAKGVSMIKSASGTLEDSLTLAIVECEKAK